MHIPQFNVLSRLYPSPIPQRDQRCTQAMTSTRPVFSEFVALSRNAACGILDGHSTTAAVSIHDAAGTPPSVTKCRLPSTRPIDQRWDRSRGIIFNARRPRTTDFTWSNGSQIVFAERSRSPSPAFRRYASRGVYNEPSKPVSEGFGPRDEIGYSAADHAETVARNRSLEALVTRQEETFKLALSSQAERLEKQAKQFKRDLEQQVGALQAKLDSQGKESRAMLGRQKAEYEKTITDMRVQSERTLAAQNAESKQARERDLLKQKTDLEKLFDRQAHLDMMKAQTVAHADEIKKLGERHAAAVAEYDQLMKDLEKEMNNKIASQKSGLESLKAEKLSAQKEKDQVRRELEETRLAKQKLESNLAESKRRAEALLARTKALGDELSRTNADKMTQVHAVSQELVTLERRTQQAKEAPRSQTKLDADALARSYDLGKEAAKQDIQTSAAAFASRLYEYKRMAHDKTVHNEFLLKDAEWMKRSLSKLKRKLASESRDHHEQLEKLREQVYALENAAVPRSDRARKRVTYAAYRQTWQQLSTTPMINVQDGFPNLPEMASYWRSRMNSFQNDASLARVRRLVPQIYAFLNTQLERAKQAASHDQECFDEFASVKNLIGEGAHHSRFLTMNLHYKHADPADQAVVVQDHEWSRPLSFVIGDSAQRGTRGIVLGKLVDLSKSLRALRPLLQLRVAQRGTSMEKARFVASWESRTLLARVNSLADTVGVMPDAVRAEYRSLLDDITEAQDAATARVFLQRAADSETLDEASNSSKIETWAQQAENQFLKDLDVIHDERYKRIRGSNSIPLTPTKPASQREKSANVASEAGPKSRRARLGVAVRKIGSGAADAERPAVQFEGVSPDASKTLGQKDKESSTLDASDVQVNGAGSSAGRVFKATPPVLAQQITSFHAQSDRIRGLAPRRFSTLSAEVDSISSSASSAHTADKAQNGLDLTRIDRSCDTDPANMSLHEQKLAGNIETDGTQATAGENAAIEKDVGTEEDVIIEEDAPTEPSYTISSKDYREAALASANSSASFWTHRLYKNLDGASPTVHYCTSFETAERQAKLFLDEKVVGFDLEWEQFASLKSHGPKQNASLIQLASESKIALFHVACFKGNSVDELMPPSLRAVLEDSKIIKTGVNVVGDSNRMRRFFNVEIKGLMELSHLYRVVKYSETTPSDVNFKLVSLATQVASVLLLPLKKDEVRVSRWASKLNSQQTEYAAADAYAGLQLFLALEQTRFGMKPRPPRPAFFEENGPLILGNGKKITRSARRTGVPAAAKKAAVKGADGEEEDSEEFFDAVEELDADETEDSMSAAVEDLALDQGSPYPTLPPLEVSGGIAPQAEASSAQRPESMLANMWVQTYLLSSPKQPSRKPTAGRSRATAGASALRAYHLWHEQGLELVQVAACCREPPLALSTVATYIMTVVKEERLPYDRDRARKVLDVLPATVHGRYVKFVDDRAR